MSSPDDEERRAVLRALALVIAFTALLAVASLARDLGPLPAIVGASSAEHGDLGAASSVGPICPHIEPSSVLA